MGARHPFKPISPGLHVALDYAQGVLLVLSPRLFGIRGTTASIVTGFAAAHAVMNAMSNAPTALHPAIPMTTHRKVEKWIAPALLAAALLCDGTRRRNFRFLMLQAFIGTAIFNLTDYLADEPVSADLIDRVPGR
jgi:hypothetical protein